MVSPPRTWLSHYLSGFLHRDGRRLLLASGFALTLFVVELILFRDSYRDRNRDSNYLELLITYQPAHIALHLGAIAGSVVLFTLFAYCASASGWLQRVVYLALLASAVAIEYSYQQVLVRFSDMTDVEPFLLITNLRTQWNALMLYFNWRAILPIALFAALLLASKPSCRRGWTAMLAVLVLTMGFYLGLARYKVLYAHDQKYPLISAHAAVRTTADYLASVSFISDVARDEIETRPASPQNNVVLIVDESIRGDHLSVNGYERETTPFLSELARRNLLLNWGIAAAGSTCSGASNRLLMTGIRPRDLPVAGNLIEKAPTIFQYAKALGYRTHYLDAQMNVVWNLGRGDMRYVDEWRPAKQFLQASGGLPEVDFALADVIRDLVTTSRGNFLWITKEGAHVPYYERVPPDEAVWKPYWTGGGWDARRRAEIVNAYDNALRYNSEGFFRRLFRDFQLPPDTVFLYTADHGESLAEQGEPLAHCGLGSHEAIVPLFMIGHPGAGVDTEYAASHENVFATLLDLFGVPDDLRAREYGISLLRATAADSAPRVFVGSDLAQRQPKQNFD